MSSYGKIKPDVVNYISDIADVILDISTETQLSTNILVRELATAIHNKKLEASARNVELRVEDLFGCESKPVGTMTGTISAEALAQLFNPGNIVAPPVTKPARYVPKLVDLIGVKQLTEACGSFIPDIKRVYMNINPTKQVTLILWEDGTKTRVNCPEGERFDGRKAVNAAVAKKILGSSSAINKVVDRLKYLSDYHTFTNELAYYTFEDAVEASLKDAKICD